MPRPAPREGACSTRQLGGSGGGGRRAPPTQRRCTARSPGGELIIILLGELIHYLFKDDVQLVLLVVNEWEHASDQ